MTAAKKKPVGPGQKSQKRGQKKGQKKGKRRETITDDVRHSRDNAPSGEGSEGREDGILIAKLPGDLRRIAEVAGVEAAISIGGSFGGTHLYIGARVGLIRELRDMRIRQDFDAGTAIRKLAQRYRISTRQIKNILNRAGDLPETSLEKLDDRRVQKKGGR